MKTLVSFCPGSLFLAMLCFAIAAGFQSTLVDTLAKLTGIGLLWVVVRLFPAPLAPAQCRAGYIQPYQGRSP